jgi:hypothetical protein
MVNNSGDTGLFKFTIRLEETQNNKTPSKLWDTIN